MEEALRDYQGTPPQDRDRNLDFRIKDLVLVTSREVGDLHAKVRDELKSAWQEVGRSPEDARDRSRNWVGDRLDSEPVLRGFVATRHADTHLGGVQVLRFVYKGRNRGGTYWMSPKIPEHVHDQLYSRSQLDQEELRRFNSRDELARTLPKVVAKVEDFVQAAITESIRIRDEE